MSMVWNSAASPPMLSFGRSSLNVSSTMSSTGFKRRRTSEGHSRAIRRAAVGNHGTSRPHGRPAAGCGQRRSGHDTAKRRTMGRATGLCSNRPLTSAPMALDWRAHRASAAAWMRRRFCSNEGGTSPAAGRRDRPSAAWRGARLGPRGAGGLSLVRGLLCRGGRATPRRPSPRRADMSRTPIAARPCGLKPRSSPAWPRPISRGSMRRKPSCTAPSLWPGQAAIRFKPPSPESPWAVVCSGEGGTTKPIKCWRRSRRATSRGPRSR